jgi:hypothetical protein
MGKSGEPFCNNTSGSNQFITRLLPVQRAGVPMNTNSLSLNG